jgi:hypothetical protein
MSAASADPTFDVIQDIPTVFVGFVSPCQIRYKRFDSGFSVRVGDRQGIPDFVL